MSGIYPAGGEVAVSSYIPPDESWPVERDIIKWDVDRCSLLRIGVSGDGTINQFTDAAARDIGHISPQTPIPDRLTTQARGYIASMLVKDHSDQPIRQAMQDEYQEARQNSRSEEEFQAVVGKRARSFQPYFFTDNNGEYTADALVWIARYILDEGIRDTEDAAYRQAVELAILYMFPKHRRKDPDDVFRDIFDAEITHHRGDETIAWLHMGPIILSGEPVLVHQMDDII